MDGESQRLRDRLSRLLGEAAEVSAALQKTEQGESGPVRYREIELAAHQVGQELSCQVQRQRIRELAAEADPQAACPKCGARCRVSQHKRKLTSIDGPVEVLEPRAHCSRCQRSFFPSA